MMAKTVRLFRAFGLMIIALVMVFILFALDVLFTLWDLIRYPNRLDNLAEKMEDVAYATDIWGNISYKNMLNVLFSKRDAHLHGKVEPISSALGKKWTQDLNTYLGAGCVGFLNWIDHLHCWKYIEGRWPARVIPPPVPWQRTVVFCVAFLLLIGIYYLIYRYWPLH
jgi:hypothetical protein